MENVYIVVADDTCICGVHKYYAGAVMEMIDLMKVNYPNIWAEYLKDYDCEEDLVIDIIDGAEVIDSCFYYILVHQVKESY